MFSIFRQKKPIVNTIDWLSVDIHSHLLPGIDDGSPNLDQSVKLITKLHQLGFRKFICTPHIFKELYPNSAETIIPALKETIEALRKANVDVEIAAAAEYMLDENFIDSVEHMTLPGNYILVEMSYLNETPNVEQIIFELQIRGYKVILAHPERYTFYHDSNKKFLRLKNMGVLFQLNLLSVTGYYGREVKRTAEYLLDNKMYNLAGTDLHNDKHLKALAEVIENGYLHTKIGHYPFENNKLFGSFN